MISKEEQRYGRNKKTIVNHTYIHSGEYRRKFDELTDDGKINRLLYQAAKEMLLHRSGTLFEDMYWIDIVSGKIAASILDSKEEQNFSMPPSIADFNSVYNNRYLFGIIACHDGRIYKYYAGEMLNENLQKLYMAIYFKRGYNEEKAQLEALQKMRDNYDMGIVEVR